MDFEDIQRRKAFISSMSDEEIRRHAERVAQHAGRSFPPGAFLEQFGNVGYDLASFVEDLRFTRYLKDIGYMIEMKPYPNGGQGCKIAAVDDK